MNSASVMWMNRGLKMCLTSTVLEFRDILIFQCLVKHFIKESFLFRFPLVGIFVVGAVVVGTSVDAEQIFRTIFFYLDEMYSLGVGKVGNVRKMSEDVATSGIG